MEKPECYGIWWEAVPGQSGDNCRECVLSGQCLALFATTRLKTVQEELQWPACTLTVLAKHLEVTEQAVLLAMAHTQRPKQTPVKEKKTESEKPQKPKKKKKKRKLKKKRNGTKSWGEHTHEVRWLQERDRNPEIAELTPGMLMKAKYKKAIHTATVRKMGYIYDNKAFPTVNAMTEHITGPKARRNSVEFWGLKKSDTK